MQVDELFEKTLKYLLYCNIGSRKVIVTSSDVLINIKYLNGPQFFLKKTKDNIIGSGCTTTNWDIRDFYAMQDFLDCFFPGKFYMPIELASKCKLL